MAIALPIRHFGPGSGLARARPTSRFFDPRFGPFTIKGRTKVTGARRRILPTPTTPPSPVVVGVRPRAPILVRDFLPDLARRFPPATPRSDPLINEAKVAAPGAGLRPAAPVACPTCAAQVDRSLETPTALTRAPALTATTPSEQRTFDMKGIGLIVLLVGGVIGLKFLKVF